MNSCPALTFLSAKIRINTISMLQTQTYSPASTWISGQTTFCDLKSLLTKYSGNLHFFALQKNK